MRFLLRGFPLLLVVGLAASTTFISDSVFDSHGSTGRNLLQTRKPCPVSFEFMNYTVITSKCRGPPYPAKLCCGAFKDFACPYAEELNDGTNVCASTMLSYINLYGKYPPGLFAGECREGKQGLACPITPEASPGAGSGASQITRGVFPPVILASVVVLGFLFP